MSRLNKLKEKLDKREAVLSTTIANVSWSGIVQKAAGFPFDFIVFDLEHGTLSIEQTEELLRVCRLCDLPSVVRVPDCIPNLISKTLDMGADGILLPRVESMEQVKTAIRAARYYPLGRKGCGGFSNLRTDDCGDVNKYNENRLIFIQIESKEGACALPEILHQCRDELAGVLIGPYDASIMLGTPLDITSSAMDEFVRNIFKTCHTFGISCGSFVDDAHMLKRYQEFGGNVFWTGTEVSLLCESYGNLCKSFSDILKGTKTC